MAEPADGKVLLVDIADEMKQSYMDYAMSVIVSRALPDVRDGLKPVQRRILYAMREAGNTPDRPFKKSARTVGDVLGKYHPHGDAAVYDALVRMAQDFTMRYPLIEGHGNYGSIDGDPPAQMRYTEARLSPLAMELMRDLDKNTVDFVPNFDETEQEPTVLPARFPNLLANGAAGIAVGMATNIPPHNLAELIDGLVAMIDAPDISLRELMKHIKGPDFPTGALILGREGIREAYEKGRGTITVRADARIEEGKGGRAQIVVTEIPYQTSKARIIEQIAELVRERRIEGITDLRDETDKTGLRIVVELSRQANPHVVLNQLFKFTALQQNFGIIMLALVGGEPKVLGLKDMLRHYLDHQKEVVVRRSRYELERAEERAHILAGLRIALDHIDEVIALIRGSRTVDEARQGLMRRFGLSEKQAQAILDMRLQRLTGLEREKVEEEYRELLKEIEYLRAVLASEKMVLGIIRRELLEIKERYGDARRTRIVSAPDAGFSPEDLIAEEDVVVTLTHQGYIKRLPLSAYRAQRRGGRGVTGVQPREEDFAEHVVLTTTHHQLLFFTDRGRVYRRVVHEVPEASRQARGAALANLVEVERGERVRAVVAVRDFEPGRYLVMATRNGLIKRTELSEFEHIRRTGLIAVTLEEGDDLVDVRLTDGRGEIMLVSRGGMAIRFPEEEVRPMGRAARGVQGMRLEPGDAVVGMDVVQEGTDVLVVTELGYGKRTPLDQYRVQARGGKGIKTARITRRNGPVTAFRLVGPEDEVLLVSQSGIVIRIKVSEIPVRGRDTEGVLLMRLDPGDRVVALAHVRKDEDE